jgi:hypothetical protein
MQEQTYLANDVNSESGYKTSVCNDRALNLVASTVTYNIPCTIQ